VIAIVTERFLFFAQQHVDGDVHVPRELHAQMMMRSAPA
jgi:hypothetical protein